MKTIIAVALLFSAVLASPVADLGLVSRDVADSDLKCLYDLWLRIKDLDKSHQGVRDFAKDVYDTYQELNENKELCESFNKENPSWFEKIMYETCSIGYKTRLEFEKARILIEARQVFKGDFWIQLVIGLDGCFR